MNNSSRYRKPPIKRTRDSVRDDKNSQANPRIDLGEARHTQVRRDKDTIRPIGITLYDVDYAIKTFIESTMKLSIDDNGETIEVPTIYANAEKWSSAQRLGYLKDKKGKTLAPMVAFRRSDVNMSELKKNKVATIDSIGYISGQRYTKTQPYDKFSVLTGTKPQCEYYATVIPDYVDVNYNFILWCEYQVQLNYLIEQFIYFSGMAFGDKNFFKFSTNSESFTMEDMNTTGRDRLVKCTFQLVVHAYLLPKEAAGEVTTKRLVTPNKFKFISEAFTDARVSLLDRFHGLNRDIVREGEDLSADVHDYTGNTQPGSPGVETEEDDDGN